MTHQHGHQHGHHNHTPAKKGLHKDWRLWVIVGLMLAGMAVYILTLDESLRPGGGPPKEPVPANASAP